MYVHLCRLSQVSFIDEKATLSMSKMPFLQKQAKDMYLLYGEKWALNHSEPLALPYYPGTCLCQV